MCIRDRLKGATEHPLGILALARSIEGDPLREQSPRLFIGRLVGRLPHAGELRPAAEG